MEVHRARRRVPGALQSGFRTLPKGLAMLSANFFLKQAMGSLVEAFSKRAQQVYKDLPTKNVPRDF